MTAASRTKSGRRTTSRTPIRTSSSSPDESGFDAAIDSLGTTALRIHTERDRLAHALRTLLAFVEDGTLVRNTSQDHAPDWALRQIPLVRVLADARATLDAYDAD